MWSAFIGFILGAIGWGITHLLFEPITEIRTLRREAQKDLIFHGNLAKDIPEDHDDRRAASDAFRRVGAGLVSQHLAAYPWVRCFLDWHGWDIHTAGAALISLGNSLRNEGYSLTNLSARVALIRQSLKLLPPLQMPPIMENRDGTTVE
jgi:hypothetical protein